LHANPTSIETAHLARNQQGRIYAARRCSGEAARGTCSVRDKCALATRWRASRGGCLLSRFAVRAIAGVVVLRGPTRACIYVYRPAAAATVLGRCSWRGGRPSRERHRDLTALPATVHYMLIRTHTSSFAALDANARRSPLARNPASHQPLSAVCSKQIRGCRINSSQRRAFLRG
jgi:hypothetical protein